MAIYVQTFIAVFIFIVLILGALFLLAMLLGTPRK